MTTGPFTFLQEGFASDVDETSALGIVSSFGTALPATTGIVGKTWAKCEVPGPGDWWLSCPSWDGNYWSERQEVQYLTTVVVAPVTLVTLKARPASAGDALVPAEGVSVTNFGYEGSDWSSKETGW